MNKVIPFIETLLSLNDIIQLWSGYNKIQDEIEKHSNDEDENCMERNKYYAPFLWNT